MKIRDFKIGWRVLVNEPSYSTIIILGLSLGIAACFLLLNLVRHQMSFDEHVPDHEKIFLLKQHWDTDANDGWYSYSSFSAHRTLQNSGLPLVSAAINVESYDLRVGEVVQKIKTAMVNEQFPEVFSLKATHGELAVALMRPDAVALTAKTAHSLFGTQDVLGKAIKINSKTLSIAAIVPTPRLTSSLQYEALTGVNTHILPDALRKNQQNSWYNQDFRVYFKTKSDVKSGDVAALLQNAMAKDKIYRDYLLPLMQQSGKKQIISHQLTPLSQQNLDPDLARGVTQDKGVLQGLTLLAFVILLLAASNYVNLAQVRTLQRQREIALHKILGASTQRVVAQFLSESILVCVIAAALGCVIAWLVLPAFSEFLGIDLNDSFSLVSVLTCLVFAILLGILSGLLPAYSALKVLPNAALQGRGDQESAQGQKLRRILSVAQMSAAIALLASALAVAWQSHFLANQNVGFDTRNLITMQLPGDTAKQRILAFASDLEKIPNVASVSMSNEPTRDSLSSTIATRAGFPAANLNFLEVTSNFFAVHGIRPLVGRLFNREQEKIDDKTGKTASNAILLNISAVSRLGFANVDAALGQFIRTNYGLSQIVGVVPDLTNVDPKKRALAMMYSPSTHGNNLTIRTFAEYASVQARITLLWSRHFPDSVLQMQTASAEIQAEISAEKNMAYLLIMASAMSLTIASFGIYVLAAHSVQKRQKQIILRKLYGASHGHILRFVGREFAILMGLACVIALPLAYRYIQVYLADYVVHAPIGVWTLVASSVIGILVAVLATLGNTLRAVHMSPLQILRG
jgi:putative ABC transport system permease protein